MIETRCKFDFENALKALRQGQALLGKEGILKPLSKRLSEAALKEHSHPILRRKD